MHKPLAIFSGVLAAVTIAPGGAHPDPRHGDSRGEGGHSSAYRGGPPQGYGERGGAPPIYRGAPSPAYGGPPRPRGGEDRYPQGGYPGDYRYAPPPPAYPEGYAPPERRPNSLGSGWREQQEEARSGVRQGQMAPLGDVIQGIGRRSAGRPLDAGIEYEGGRAVYRVRWLMSNGRRVDYMVDAATGRILSEH